MGIRQLRTLIAVADEGSFSAASHRLFMTPSAVSMQMKALEDELRLELFDRTRRPPVLNASAWLLIDEAREIVKRYDLLRTVAEPSGSGVAGLIRLGVIPSIATTLLPALVADVRLQHPLLRIQIHGGLSPELAFKVEQRQLDLAVITEPEQVGATLSFASVREDELMLVVHADLGQGTIADMLVRHPFLRFNPALGVGRTIDATLRSRSLSVNEALELDSIEIILRMVKLKLGVTIIPVDPSRSDLDEMLRCIAFDPPVTRRVGLVFRRGMMANPLVLAMAQAFRATANTVPS